MGVIMKIEREDGGGWGDTSQTEDNELSKSADSSKGSRGKKGKGDVRVKLERSRQSARECRARKKLRYQYVDDIIMEREKANDVLREELTRLVDMCHELDK